MEPQPIMLSRLDRFLNIILRMGFFILIIVVTFLFFKSTYLYRFFNEYDLLYYLFNIISIFLPIILGIIGLIFLFRKNDRKKGFVVLIFILIYFFIPIIKNKEDRCVFKTPSEGGFIFSSNMPLWHCANSPENIETTYSWITIFNKVSKSSYGLDWVD